MEEIADIVVAALQFHAVDDNNKTAPTDDVFHEKLKTEGLESIIKDIWMISEVISQSVFWVIYMGCCFWS